MKINLGLIFSVVTLLIGISGARSLWWVASLFMSCSIILL